MRICIFGAGSLGSALGSVLAEKHEVVIVGRKPHVDAVAQNGLTVAGEREGTIRIDARDSLEGLAPPDLLVMTTKAYNTKEAVLACRRLDSNDLRVITLQNGLGNLEALRSWKGAKAYGCTTTMGAVLVSPGIVRISGFGRTIVGSDLDPDGAEMIARMFVDCGMKAEVKKDIVSEIWGKAVVNACINPITAILKVSNGELLRSAATSELLKFVCQECESVAHAAGVTLAHSPMIERVRHVAAETAQNRSSMLRDVELGRRTEIAQINGMFCKHGMMHGLRTPLNRALVSMVESLEPLAPGERLIS